MEIAFFLYHANLHACSVGVTCCGSISTMIPRPTVATAVATVITVT